MIIFASVPLTSFGDSVLEVYTSIFGVTIITSFICFSVDNVFIRSTVVINKNRFCPGPGIFAWGSHPAKAMGGSTSYEDVGAESFISDISRW